MRFLGVLVLATPQLVPRWGLDTENDIQISRGRHPEIFRQEHPSMECCNGGSRDQGCDNSCTGVFRRRKRDMPRKLGGKSDLQRRLDSFKMTPVRASVKEMGKIDDLDAAILPAGQTLGHKYMCTMLID